MATKIQLRRDTAADWTSNNPTMAAGEFGWESNTNRFKIGDGSTAWNSLAYADTLKSLGDMTIIGSTISAPTNGDLTLQTSGSGIVFVNDSLKIGSGATVTTILDEDAMGTNSATSLATQQSIKAYVDANAGGDVGDFTFNGSTIITPSNADLTLSPGGTGGVVASGIKIKGTSISSDDSTIININDGLVVDGSLTLQTGASVTGIADEDNFSSDSATLLATQQSIKAYIATQIATKDNSDEITEGSTNLYFTNTRADARITAALIDEDDMSTNSASRLPSQQSVKAYVDNEIANVSVGDLTFNGSTIAAPSSADLTLVSSNGNVVVEGIRFAGTVISTEDSTSGVEIAGNLIPSQDGVFQLGSSTRRWQTAYLSANTIDLGGATISSDGTGSVSIAATGATLPTGSKIVDQSIITGGKTTKTGARPVQIVKIFVSDGSTVLSDAQLLAGTADLELEFNGTIEDVPVYTEANQIFTLSNGDALNTNAAGITLFQF